MSEIKQRPHFRLEEALISEGLWPVAGVDEVGRGPLAGPVAAAAVILDPRRIPKGLNDSKALTARAREEALTRIVESALAIGVAFVSAEAIDVTDIRKAALRAMARAVAGLALPPAFILVDGRDIPEGCSCPGRAVIKGDATSASIAAASIVAKVARDGAMRRLGEAYPGYGFESHMGYGSRQHRAAIETLGPTPFHRMSFSPLRLR
jgi:ribonuclease HII